MNRWTWLAVALQLSCGSESAPAPDAGSGTKWAPKVAPAVLVAPPIVCDSSVKSVTHCGDVHCPEVPVLGAFACPVNCCTNQGKCGTHDAEANDGGRTWDECIENAVPDSRCPSSPAGPGCCDRGNHCGIVLDNECVAAEEPWLPTCAEAPAYYDGGL